MADDDRKHPDSLQVHEDRVFGIRHRWCSVQLQSQPNRLISTIYRKTICNHSRTQALVHGLAHGGQVPDEGLAVVASGADVAGGVGRPGQRVDARLVPLQLRHRQRREPDVQHHHLFESHQSAEQHASVVVRVHPARACCMASVSRTVNMGIQRGAAAVALPEQDSGINPSLHDLLVGLSCLEIDRQHASSPPCWSP
jgi:hypothetical protein